MTRHPLRIVTAAAVLPFAAAGVGYTAAGTSSPKTVAGAAASCAPRTVLPAYFYPGSTWQSALTAAKPGDSIIVNPSSGPGANLDPNYQQVVEQARSEGAQLWGYIDTKYTQVSLPSLAAQVAEYRNWYGITDMFFDDVSSSADDVGYYQQASALVRSGAPAASVMLNPGDYPDPSYATLGDTIVVFEGAYTSFVDSRPPSWVASYPASTFADLVSAVPAVDLQAVIDLSGRDNAGYLYATDHVDKATLYEQLPGYWTDELSALANGCSSAASPPVPSAPPPTTTTPSPTAPVTAGAPTSSAPAPSTPSTPPPTTPPTTTTTVVPSLPPTELPSGAGTTPQPTGHGSRARLTNGYWMATAKGVVYGVRRQVLGSLAGRRLNQPVVGVAPTADGRGYWLVARDGGVFTFGDARFAGSLGDRRISSPIVGMALDRATGGYWLAAANGAVYGFDAPTLHSTRGRRPAESVVCIVATTDGRGYWLVTKGGGIFAFGAAPFHGSLGGHSSSPIVGMALDRATGGYWLAAANGAVHGFDAPTLRPTRGHRPNREVIGIAATNDGRGYWLAARSGEIIGFGTAIPAALTHEGRLPQLITSLAGG